MKISTFLIRLLGVSDAIFHLSGTSTVVKILHRPNGNTCPQGNDIVSLLSIVLAHALAKMVSRTPKRRILRLYRLYLFSICRK
jgi:hypothetical protein